MFEAAEPGVEVDALLQAQRVLAASKQSCVILVSGVEGAGKREVVNFLLKLHARLKVLKTVTEALEGSLQG